MNDFIYIASPFRGAVEINTEKARSYCCQLVEEGKIPIAPHLYFPQFLKDDDPQERECSMAMNRKLLSFCEELRVFGEETTSGMEEEIRVARELGIPVTYEGSKE